jgi:hypothetical protein
MKNTTYLLICLLAICASNAQDEVLSPIKSNPNLFRDTYPFQTKKNNQASYHQQGNTIIITDTLSLPFIDDFSANTLKAYNHNLKKIDSVVYALGRCITVGNFTTEEYPYMLRPTFRYFFNTTTKALDSVANTPAIIYLIDSPTLCLSYTVKLSQFYPPQYTLLKVDSASGKSLDSLMVKADTLLRLAKLSYTHLNNTILWMDNYAYINSTFPLNPPTIGVATLDGLNEFGLPYNKSSVLAYGVADYLTSRPLDLGSLNNADSIYLSFFYEPKGLGDFPNAQDSLILEFKDNKDQWRRVWGTGGYTTEAEMLNTFKQILIKFPFPVFPTDPLYFYKGFQFRFKNYASLTGNNDHWHIDYVRLDKNRNAEDTLIKDVSFVYPMPSILKEYSLMPPDHFHPDSSIIDTLTIYNNYLGSPFQNDYCIGADNAGINTFITCPIYNTSVNQIFKRALKDFNIPKQIGDSTSVKIFAYTKTQADIASNDTLVGYQVFSNLLAYDDGSAEKGYGLQGNGLKKLAYEFNFIKKDTLSGIRIHYTNIDENVKDLIFNINVWDSISLNNAYDRLLAEIVNRKPTYIDPVNSFIYYKLDTPLILSGKFYIGFTQTDLRNLQIGYDVNSTKGKDKIFIYSSGAWKKSSVTMPGSPMIQAIVDGNCKNCLTSAEVKKATTATSFSIYPNPTQGLLHISTDSREPYHVTIFSMKSASIHSSIYSNNQTLDISDLESGIYIVQFTTKQQHSYHKIIKE